MTWRTPPSLKWLIVKRSRISGALLRLDQQATRLRGELAQVEEEAAVLRQRLGALDQTFGLHEISMDPEDIRPVRSPKRERLMPYGQLSRAILGALREAGEWMTWMEILERIADRINPNETDYVEVSRCLRRRLGWFAREGIVERQGRFEAHGGCGETLWRLADLRSRATKSVF